MRMGKVTLNSCAKSRDALTLSCETPRKETSAPPYCLKTRSRKGNVNLQTGQETLKKERTTGPRCSAEASENSLQSSDLSATPGATFPGTTLGTPSSGTTPR